MWRINDKGHYSDIMMGDQLRGHPDLKKFNRFGFFSILYRKLRNFFS